MVFINSQKAMGHGKQAVPGFSDLRRDIQGARSVSKVLAMRA